VLNPLGQEIIPSEEAINSGTPMNRAGNKESDNLRLVSPGGTLFSNIFVVDLAWLVFGENSLPLWLGLYTPLLVYLGETERSIMLQLTIEGAGEGRMIEARVERLAQTPGTEGGRRPDLPAGRLEFLSGQQRRAVSSSAPDKLSVASLLPRCQVTDRRSELQAQEPKLAHFGTRSSANEGTTARQSLPHISVN
jgi:hypothetical protein